MIMIIRQATSLLFLFTLILGVVYPGLLTVIAATVFNDKSSGSLIYESNPDRGKISALVGSELLGQQFTGNHYFWSRPSATPKYPYNIISSQGSNMSLFNLNLINQYEERIDNLLHSDITNPNIIPVDLITASGSGIDPHISPAAAYYQINRIAKARNIEIPKVLELIKKHTEARQFGILGEPRVNVLKLNLALDLLNDRK